MNRYIIEIQEYLKRERITNIPKVLSLIYKFSENRNFNVILLDKDDKFLIAHNIPLKDLKPRMKFNIGIEEELDIIGGISSVPKVCEFKDITLEMNYFEDFIIYKQIK